MKEPFRITDPRQERIFRRLQLVGKGPAAFFRDACELLAQSPPMETTSHLVSHLIRDIESALRDVLETVAARSERISKGSSSEKDRHAQEIKVILKALDIPKTHPVSQAWLSLTGRENSYGLHKRAHRRSLQSPRPVDDEFREFWDKIQSIFEFVLGKLEARFLEFIPLLDQLLAKTSPTSDDIKLLAGKIPASPILLGYFFKKLESLSWVIPLREGGFFTIPPEPETDPEDRGVRFPLWVELEYLARMASRPEVQETCVEIALAIPATANFRIHEALADLACRLEPHLAARFVPEAESWLKNEYQIFELLPEKLGVLVRNLALGGETQAAMRLSRVLLEVLPDPRAGRKHGDAALAPRPRPRIDLHDYEQILEKNIPDLVAAFGLEALALLCDLLESGIKLSSDKGELRSPDDASVFWRAAIEEDDQNLSEDVRAKLVAALRDAAEQIARKDPSQITSLVRTLESRKWWIFRRIALHLLRKFPETGLPLIEDQLLNPETWEISALRHEVFSLLKETFSKVSLECRTQILDRIDKGPDLAAYKSRWEKLEGKNPTTEEMARYKKHWQRDWLFAISDSLPAEWKKRYDELLKEVGQPTDLARYPVHSATWVGPTSPKSTEDLRQMTGKKILEFLKTWKPSNDPMESSQEGLGRCLTPLAASDPARFASVAALLKEVDPTYVRAVFQGWREAVQQKQCFEWKPILDLTTWVIQQPREIPGRQGRYADLDPGWVWTRRAIASLLREGFNEGPAQIPFEFRDAAWKVLADLVEDPDPTPKDEEKFGGSNMDPATLSINAVRGEAMHAVMRYTVWVHLHLKALPNGKAQLEKGFDAMPEVRQVLETHLDPKRDPSLAVRSVYGWSFPHLLQFADKQWTLKMVPTIFPAASELAPFRDAAWETYLAYCAPYHDVFDALENQYRHAIENIGTSRTKRRSSTNQDQRLAEHLVTLYWQGKLDIEDPKGVLQKFYSKAPEALCGRVIEYVGRSLHSTKGEIEKAPLERLKTLWAIRLALHKKKGKKAASEDSELSSFGWWFSSKKFDEDWALHQLQEAQAICGTVEPDHLVVEYLVELAPRKPLDAVRRLAGVIEGDRKGWGIHGWKDEARSILEIALQNGEAATKSETLDLVHKLGARGFLEFRDLYEKGNSGSAASQ